MGYPNTDLIVPAILLNKPGITKEEFVEILNNVRTSSLREFGKYAKWGSYGGKEWEGIANGFHKGMHGLAEILHLPYNKKYVEWINQERKDKWGLYLRPPVLLIIPRKENNIWASPGFEVHEHIKNKVEKPIKTKELSWDKLEKGDIWSDLYDLETGIVEKIIKETPPKKTNDREDSFDNNVSYYKYEMIIRRFYGIHAKEKFKNIEDLIKKHPYFHYDYLYDFSVKKGKFYTGIFGGDFIWKKKNNKYYLDEDTFNNIPAGWRKLQRGYTDLILTAEAIKHKAWKLLTYRGLKHVPYFLKKFPDSKLRYERAVWDSHTFLAAREKKMTISECLRWRLLPPNAI